MRRKIGQFIYECLIIILTILRQIYCDGSEIILIIKLYQREVVNQVIYVDILIAVNIFINYFILIATSKFLYVKINRSRIIWGSLLGAVYSLYILFPKTPFAVSLAVKFLMSATIVWVAFCSPKSKVFLKSLLCFYSMSFIFSGTMFAIWCLLEPRGLFVNNNIVYFNISPLILIISTVISYGIIQFINKIVGRQNNKNVFCDIKIKVSSKLICVKAKIDTGHNLKEPFSGLPVIVLCKRASNGMIPDEFLEVSHITNKEEGEKNVKCEVCNKLRLIPFSSISGGGILPAIKADYVLIEGDSKEMKKDAYVAVCPDSVMPEDFDALLSPELFG